MNDISVLNAMVGCHNVVDNEQITNIMDGMLSTIEDILKDHCGPYGKLAMLPPATPIGEPMFTKDGINIVDAIECINAVEQVTKSLISYIGSRVERRAGDGTTTAMLLSVNLLKQFRVMLGKNQIDYNGFIEMYKEVIEKLLNSYFDLRVSTDHTDVRNIVLRQAFTSSHGDIELSNLVANTMAHTPKDNLDNLMFVRSRKETNDVYSVQENDTSFSTEANVFDTRMYNSIIGNGVELKDGTLIVTSTSLYSNSPEYTELKNTLSKLTVDDKPIVVVTGHGLDNRVTGELLELHEEKRREGVRFYMFRVVDSHPKINALNGLFASLNKDRDALMDSSVTCTFNELRFDEGVLYIYSDDMLEYDDNNLCKAHDDQDTPVGKFLTICYNYIENSNVIDEHKTGLAGTLDIARWMVNTIKYKSFSYFVIGGAGYDNRAAIDILTDVLKSSRSALKYGIASAGLVDLITASKNTHLYFTNKHGSSSMYSRISKCILDAIKATRIIILTTSKKISKHRAKSLLYKKVKLKETPLNIEASETCASIEEALTRFGEVAIRYLFTSNVMIPGGVFVPEEKLDQ